MTDEDIRQMVREFKSFVSSELEDLHDKIDSMEAGLINEIKSLSNRIASVERRTARLESN